MKTLHEGEKMILNELRKNARVSLLEVAKKTNIPLSTVYDRLRQYENGIIRKHAAIVDFASLGYFSRAIVILKVKKEDRQNFLEYLSNHPNINTLYRTNSDSDFIFELISRNEKETNDILEDLEYLKGFVSKSCFTLIDDIKREDFLIK